MDVVRAQADSASGAQTDLLLKRERAATVLKLKAAGGQGGAAPAIFEHAVLGDVESVRAALNTAVRQGRTSLIDERSPTLGRSVLHEACANGHRALAICLVEEFDADLHKVRRAWSARARENVLARTFPRACARSLRARNVPCL